MSALLVSGLSDPACCSWGWLLRKLAICAAAAWVGSTLHCSTSTQPVQSRPACRGALIDHHVVAGKEVKPPLSPTQSSEHMLSFIDRLEESHTGRFFFFDGCADGHLTCQPASWTSQSAWSQCASLVLSGWCIQMRLK